MNMTKQFIHLFSATLIASVLISCGGKKQEAIVAPQGMHVLDLSRFGKPFAIFVPDTTSAKFEIIEQPSGALDIKVGKNFALSINEAPADIELRKADIKGDDVNKFKSFVAEEPTAILWESEITQPEFHFLMNQKVGNAEYSFEDIRDPESNPLGKEAVQKMFDSSKSIKEMKKENHS